MRKPIFRSLVLALAICSLATLTACGRDAPAPEAGADAPSAEAADDGFIARSTRRALESARRDLAQKNISVGGTGSGGLDINGFRFGGNDARTAGLPRAEISPAGDLLIDGEPVAVDTAQRDLLLAHRANIVAIAEAGIVIGVQGAQLGAEAAKGAVTSLLAGNAEAFEQRMQAEAKKIEAEAQTLCGHLPDLLASQQALAAALPAFRPYATMDAGDVEDCRKDAAGGDNPAAEADAATEMASR